MPAKVRFAGLRKSGLTPFSLMLIGGQRDKVCRQLPSRSTTGDLTDAKRIEFRNFANCGLSRIDQKIINPTGSQNTESVCEQVRCSDAYGRHQPGYAEKL